MDIPNSRYICRFHRLHHSNLGRDRFALFSNSVYPTCNNPIDILQYTKVYGDSPELLIAYSTYLDAFIQLSNRFIR